MIKDPHHALARGYMLDGYKIEHVVGSGGFGITYKATDVALEKPVAIKEYIPADIAVRLDDTTIAPKSKKMKTILNGVWNVFWMRLAP